MIYLIGGSSHVGKTLLAQKIMEKIQAPYLSLDHLKMGLIRAQITDLQVEQDGLIREYMWPIVTEIIKTVIENEQNLIVEGCYIPGDWARSFSEKYLANIRSVFIVMDERYIRTHAEDIVRYGDIIEKRVSKSVDIDRLVSCSAMFEKWAKENESPCLKIDTSFSMEQLTSKAFELLGIDAKKQSNKYKSLLLECL